jgi:hypothetical protein
MTYTRAVLRTNSRAVIDGSGGLIPCVVTGIRGDAGNERATVTIARTGKGYTRGESVTMFALFVVPRCCIRTRQYHTIILPYTIEVN